MKISSIKAQVKNQDRVSIFIDGKYSFSLSLNELVAEKLKNNQELTEADIKKLKKLSEDGKLKARALEWALNRPRSKREFNDYLYRKKADKEFIELLITEFEGRGYLSDQNYATWLMDLRRRKGKSERAIKSELFSKGVAREIVDSVMENANDEQERLKILIAKKSKLSRYKTDKQKLMQYLVSQGFKYSDIKTQLENTD